MMAIRTPVGTSLLSRLGPLRLGLIGKTTLCGFRSLRPQIFIEMSRRPTVPTWSRNITTRHIHTSSILLRETKPREKITKSTLLAEAKGPISRLFIHIKWPLKRDNMPYSLDDLSAFASWLVMGNVLWIVLGTTTFGLVLLYSLHTFDSVTSKILHYFDNSEDHGDDEENKSTGGARPKEDNSIVGYITSALLSHGLGVKIIFEKGKVLPRFQDSKLIFDDIRIVSADSTGESTALLFECVIKSMSVSLSFHKWYEGNGLINDLTIKGMNGKVLRSENHRLTQTVDPDDTVVFRRYNDNIHFQYDMGDQDEVVHQSKRKLKIDPNYELNSVIVHDSYIEVSDVYSDEPLKFSIFSCELPKLRGETMLIDFFNANNVSGAINDSMFTIHKRQAVDSSEKYIRFKIDGIDMGTLSSINPRAKFNWILNGKADITADIRLPTEDESISLFKSEYNRITQIFSTFLDDLSRVTREKNADSHNEESVSREHSKLMKGALQAIYETFNMNNEKDNLDNAERPHEYVIVNAKIKFRNLKAALPKELPMATNGNVPFVTLHDLKTIIAYINNLDAEKTSPILVKTTVIEKLSDLYNLENLTRAKMFDVIISDIYEDFLKMVKADEKRIIEEKSSLWSHSLASQLLLLGLGVIV